MTHNLEQMRIRDDGIGSLPYIAIKIEGRSATQPNIVSTGTGFFYSLETEESTIPLIVTNKHVLNDHDTITLHFAKMNEEGYRVLGTSEKINIRTSDYKIFHHPDHDVDLACIPIGPILESFRFKEEYLQFKHLNKSNLPPEWLKDNLSAATEILMVGYPNGLMDVTNNLPITRKGILATPYYADHNGQRNFVVDVAAFGGSSGSPVFAFFKGVLPTREGPTLGDTAIYLIGVLHSGPILSVGGEITCSPIPTSGSTSRTRLMMHLGYCLRAEIIEEMLPQIVDHIKRYDFKYSIIE